MIFGGDAMVDDTTKRQPEDPKRVNINQEHEIAYWCKKWAISKDRLLKLVKEVGPMVADILKKLKR